MGKLSDATAEMLMRSRFSAYRLGLVDYLLETTAPKARDKRLRSEIENTANTTEWLSLEIIQTQQGGPRDKMGKVEFVAQYRNLSSNGTSSERALHELSRFTRYQGPWVYLDGKIFG